MDDEEENLMPRKNSVRNIYIRDEMVWARAETLARVLDLSLSRFVERAVADYNIVAEKAIERGLAAGEQK